MNRKLTATAILLMVGTALVPINFDAAEAPQSALDACTYTDGTTLRDSGINFFSDITLEGDVDCNGATIESSKYPYGDRKGYSFMEQDIL